MNIDIRAQEGPQENFLTTVADICIYGGAAGGGKTFGLLLEPIRHFYNVQFSGVIFRRTSIQIRNPGGLWDESYKIYPLLGAEPRMGRMEWLFPKGGKLKFAHLEHDKNVYDWQGSAIPLLCFDELTHFSKQQFFYMLSRNRSTSGIPGYVRATTNPDAKSWVREFIDWWIGKDGYPLKERDGIVRWFIRQDDKIIWADSREELIATYGKEELPKSVTFISSNIYDNKILMEKDPSYLSNLKALSRVDRMRLLGGNWNVVPSAGNLFRQEWFELVDAVPAGYTGVVRFWDRAATKPSEENPDPDYTRGLKLYKYPDGTFVVGDLRTTRNTPGEVEKLIVQTAQHDGPSVKIMCQQDPGSAGKAESEHFIRMLRGYHVRTLPFSKDKVTRAKAVSAQAEGRNIKLLRASWNQEFLEETENFPDGAHDDIVDTLSGAFNDLISKGASILDTIRRA